MATADKLKTRTTSMMKYKEQKSVFSLPIKYYQHIPRTTKYLYWKSLLGTTIQLCLPLNPLLKTLKRTAYTEHVITWYVLLAFG